MTAANPSRNKPAPSRRPGRFVEAAADMELDAMAEQVGLALPSRLFRHECSFAGSPIEGTLADLCLSSEHPDVGLKLSQVIFMYEIAIGN